MVKQGNSTIMYTYKYHYWNDLMATRATHLKLFLFKSSLMGKWSSLHFRAQLLSRSSIDCVQMSPISVQIKESIIFSSEVFIFC